MIGGLIGGALGAIGGLFGGLSKQRQQEQQRQMVEAAQRENQAFYDRRYNEDATQRADAQRVLSMTEEQIRRRNRQAAGTAAVMGGSTESVAAARAANAQAYSDTASQIAAAGADRKDKVEDAYLKRKDAYNDELRKIAAGTPSVLDIASGVVGGAASGVAKGMNI